MERPRLDSWKDIAAYVGRDVRTAARWEHERNLPVHRVPGGGRAHVFAYTEELDAWLAGGLAAADDLPRTPGADPRPADVRRGRRWTWVAAVGCAAVAVFAGVWATNRPEVPSSGAAAARVPHNLSIVGSELVALGEDSQVLWAHRFPGRSLRSIASSWFDIRDLDADGVDDVLATVEITGPAAEQRGGGLLKFTGDGRLCWEAALADRLEFRDSPYGPPWSTAGFEVLSVGGQTRIVWLVHQFTWWPGMMVSYDVQGRRLATFVNSGWIRAVAASTDGRHLVATGISNARGAYFLAVLDARRPAGHSPEPPGSRTECLNCPEGAPLYYFVFPRTDLGLNQPFPADGPSVQVFPDGAVQVQTHESSEPAVATVVYDFGPDFTLRQARLSDSFWAWHRRLETAGVLRHPVEQCPVGRGLSVQRWSPGGGWEPVRVSVAAR